MKLTQASIGNDGLAADIDEADRRIGRLSGGVEWHTDIDWLLSEAKRRGSMVFLQHMLADMDGVAWSAAHSLRAIARPDDEVMAVLGRQFLCGFRNVGDQPWCGNSAKHPRRSRAVYPANGAGPRNTQGFLLAPDGVVLHALLGYWHPKDFLCELSLARELCGLWQNPSLSRADKDARFAELHRSHIAIHSEDMRSRSGLMGLDEEYELARAGARQLIDGARDIIVRDRKGRVLRAIKWVNKWGTQLLFLSGDGRVLHALTGPWRELDLAHELVFAKKMNKLWLHLDWDLGAKNQHFVKRHLEQAEDWPAREQTQRFTLKAHECLARHPFTRLSEFPFIEFSGQGQWSFEGIPEQPLDPPVADLDARGYGTIKRADEIMHERMALRPFVHYRDFDTPVYSDYGRIKYHRPQFKHGRPPGEPALPKSERLRRESVSLTENSSPPFRRC